MHRFNDTIQRAIRTFAQAFIAAIPISDSGPSITAFVDWELWSVGFGGAALSIFMTFARDRK
tara:strand:+ start:91 stop:276 length:186 start_codon:yes stop_codon:yes gene_type:complete